MPIVQNFKGVMPDTIYQPNAFIQGASTGSLPWGLILLDTGYSGDLAIAQSLRCAIGIPAGKKVALKVVLPTAEIILDKAAANEKPTRIDSVGMGPTTTVLNVSRDAILCVDQELEAKVGRDDYNVLSIGFAQALNRKILIRNDMLCAIDHPHSQQYEKTGLTVVLPEVTVVSVDQVFPFHKELNVMWGGNSPYVQTRFVRADGRPQDQFVLWDTGADVNLCTEEFKGRKIGRDEFVMDEVIVHAADGTEFTFLNVPFVLSDNTTIGAPILNAFAELGIGGGSFSVAPPPPQTIALSSTAQAVIVTSAGTDQTRKT